jgi:hypothetical protein
MEPAANALPSTVAPGSKPKKPRRSPYRLLDALDDPILFAPAFAQGEGSAWRAFLAAVQGLPMVPVERLLRARPRESISPPAAGTAPPHTRVKNKLWLWSARGQRPWFPTDEEF